MHYALSTSIQFGFYLTVSVVCIGFVLPNLLIWTSTDANSFDLTISFERDNSQAKKNLFVNYKNLIIYFVYPQLPTFNKII